LWLLAILGGQSASAARHTGAGTDSQYSMVN